MMITDLNWSQIHTWWLPTQIHTWWLPTQIHTWWLPTQIHTWWLPTQIHTWWLPTQIRTWWLPTQIHTWWLPTWTDLKYTHDDYRLELISNIFVSITRLFIMLQCSSVILIIGDNEPFASVNNCITIFIYIIINSIDLFTYIKTSRKIAHVPLVPQFPQSCNRFIE